MAYGQWPGTVVVHIQYLLCNKTVHLLVYRTSVIDEIKSKWACRNKLINRYWPADLLDVAPVLKTITKHTKNVEFQMFEINMGNQSLSAI